jgi:TadE-like protein
MKLTDTYHQPASGRLRQRGSAMIEFTIVGPIITLLGLAILQYGMLFFAKNQINHASFMAARAGSVKHASITPIRDAYTRALIPLYGGGRDFTELSEALVKATADTTAANVRIDILNPTAESFDDWNDVNLQNDPNVGNGRQVIPNAGQAFKNPSLIKTNSGQSIQDANLIKLRITHGYEPKVPFVNTIYTTYLKWLDTNTDAFHTALVNNGRVPVVTHITLQMQSDAIRPDNPVSLPGPGNNGNPTNPGDPPVVTTDPPNCRTVGCTVTGDPKPPKVCDPVSDPDHCRPPGCNQGDINCDPGCYIGSEKTGYCCLPKK